MNSARVNWRRHILVVAGLWIVASVNLNLKVAASYEPRHWGTYYATLAATPSDLNPRISFRWFGPWLAHHLGFDSVGLWLLFLYLCFMVTITLWYCITVIGQLIIAVDSVRVIDLLLFPLSTAVICCFDSVRDHAGRGWLLGALITALIINQLLPVWYVGQNMIYAVPSRLAGGQL